MLELSFYYEDLFAYVPPLGSINAEQAWESFKNYNHQQQSSEGYDTECVCMYGTHPGRGVRPHSPDSHERRRL